MTVHAVAILQVSYVQVCSTVGVRPASGHAAARTETAPFAPLGEDGTACFLGVAMDSEPDDLAAMVRLASGEALDLHNDARGVFVAPEKSWPANGFGSYAAALETYDGLGEWLPKVSEAEAREHLGDAMDALGGDLPDLGAGGLDGMQAMLSGNPDLLRAAQDAAQRFMTRDSAPDLGALMNDPQMLAMAEQMMRSMSPEQLAGLQAMAGQLFAGGMPGMPGMPIDVPGEALPPGPAKKK